MSEQNRCYRGLWFLYLRPQTRQKTSEARDYFDNKKSEKKAFKMDVEHLFKDERFRNALEKWNKNDPVYKGKTILNIQGNDTISFLNNLTTKNISDQKLVDIK